MSVSVCVFLEPPKLTLVETIIICALRDRLASDATVGHKRDLTTEGPTKYQHIYAFIDKMLMLPYKRATVPYKRAIVIIMKYLVAGASAKYRSPPCQ